MSTGSCVCKKITYSFMGEPVQKAVCHCRECQRLTGSAFTYNFLVLLENFKIDSGHPKEAKFIQESGVEVQYSFCGDCGNTIFKKAIAKAFAPFILIQAGTVNGSDVAKFTPDVELWTSRRADWLPGITGVEQRAQF